MQEPNIILENKVHVKVIFGSQIYPYFALGLSERDPLEAV